MSTAAPEARQVGRAHHLGCPAVGPPTEPSSRSPRAPQQRERIRSRRTTEAGQYAALEWSGQGSILTDGAGRDYIDCLGGYGVFSAGVNHPRVVGAVAAQLRRVALNSQELLEPWRGALARVLAE